MSHSEPVFDAIDTTSLSRSSLIRRGVDLESLPLFRTYAAEKLLQENVVPGSNIQPLWSDAHYHTSASQLATWGLPAYEESFLMHLLGDGVSDGSRMILGANINTLDNDTFWNSHEIFRLESQRDRIGARMRVDNEYPDAFAGPTNTHNPFPTPFPEHSYTDARRQEARFVYGGQGLYRMDFRDFVETNYDDDNDSDAKWHPVENRNVQSEHTKNYNYRRFEVNRQVEAPDIVSLGNMEPSWTTGEALNVIGTAPITVPDGTTSGLDDFKLHAIPNPKVPVRYPEDESSHDNDQTWRSYWVRVAIVKVELMDSSGVGVLNEDTQDPLTLRVGQFTIALSQLEDNQQMSHLVYKTYTRNAQIALLEDPPVQAHLQWEIPNRKESGTQQPNNIGDVYVHVNVSNGGGISTLLNGIQADQRFAFVPLTPYFTHVSDKALSRYVEDNSGAKLMSCMNLVDEMVCCSFIKAVSRGLFTNRQSHNFAFDTIDLAPERIGSAYTDIKLALDRVSDDLFLDGDPLNIPLDQPPGLKCDEFMESYCSQFASYDAETGDLTFPPGMSVADIPPLCYCLLPADVDPTLRAAIKPDKVHCFSDICIGFRIDADDDRSSDSLPGTIRFGGYYTTAMREGFRNGGSGCDDLSICTNAIIANVGVGGELNLEGVIQTNVGCENADLVQESELAAIVQETQDAVVPELTRVLQSTTESSIIIGVSVAVLVVVSLMFLVSVMYRRAQLRRIGAR